MTHSEALGAVETLFTNLDLTDRSGDPIEGLLVVAVIAKLLPDRLEALENQFFSYRISPEEYVEEMKRVIEEFKRLRFISKLDKQLAELKEGA